MVPAIAVLTSAAHALFLLVFGVLWFAFVPPADAASGGFAGCPAALHYDVFMVGLLACFGLMLVLELALIYAGMKGAEEGIESRRKRGNWLSIDICQLSLFALTCSFFSLSPLFPSSSKAPRSRSPSGNPSSSSSTSSQLSGHCSPS
jgi:hypothetical protein